MRSAIAVMASETSGATSTPSCETNRAARIMRRGSSEKDDDGVPGVRSIPAWRSRTPPNRSTSSSEGRRRAMALMVKSRRRRSSSRLEPKATTGFREAGSYASARYVVISIWKPFFRNPMVPNARPISQWASAQPLMTASVRPGSASVVKSRSGDTRPRKRSLTGPPTSDNSWPAASKSRPTSRTTGGRGAVSVEVSSRCAIVLQGCQISSCFPHRSEHPGRPRKGPAEAAASSSTVLVP